MKTIKSPFRVIFGSVTLLFIFLLVSCNKEPQYAGYKLIEKRFVKEVNADCYYFEHIKSGARIFKIAADDPNKTFSIAFKTVPQSDAGTPHIMEHSVLNGSKNFPVKSPFDVLMKGSLNTFLNAMTSSDWTAYPVASMNDKDYFNLMHVYLDAVFNPLIYQDQRIFMQEGWHYELTSKDAPLVYKGVVYNEMKGAYSSPTREMSYQVMKNLFPTNGYSFSSGGYPTAIPTLTYDQFLDFHRKFYHPSNSYILLYGNADLNKELEFIDKEYLSKYDRPDVKADFPINPPFDAVKEMHGYYPVIEGAPTKDQSYISMNYVIGLNTDMSLTMSLNVLADVLVNQESAPLRKALQEAGIGKDVYAYNNNIQQNVFTIVVQNANAGDSSAFKKILYETLNKVVKEGIDKETLKGVLNRMEFSLREGDDAQKGLTYDFQCLTGWMFAGNPFLGIEYEKPLAEVKKSLEGRSLEDIVQKDLIDNKYGLLFVLEPKTGLEKENNAIITEELAKYKATLSDADLDKLIATTKELVSYQQREDTPEALATIPMLKREDIGKEATWYEAKEKDISGIPTLYYPEFTNGILYVNSWFDLRTLPQEMLPYASLLKELLGKMSTESFTYDKLEKELNIQTGGFYSYLSTYLPEGNDKDMIPMLNIGFKATPDKITSAFNVVNEIVNKTLYTDKTRLGELLGRHQAQLEQQFMQNGIGVATGRLESYLSNNGVFNELTGGADYYWFITDLKKQFDKDPDAVIAKLQEVTKLLFTKGNLMLGVTCNDEDMNLFTGSCEQLVNALPDNKVEKVSWNFAPKSKNEAFMTASKVQYVVKGFDYRQLGFDWSGKMRVLSQILSTDWLQTRIRVIGGAYGGWAAIDRSGLMYFASYRDPNLKETLANYDATADYLKNFTADSTTMTRYIIGTVAGLDQPMTPSQKGNTAFYYYFSKINREQMQKERDEVLSTSAEDIKGMSDLVSAMLGKNIICVYGNEEKIKSNKTLFENLVVLQK